MMYEFETKFNIGDVVMHELGTGIIVNMQFNIRFNLVEVFVMFTNESKWLSEDSLKLKSC